MTEILESGSAVSEDAIKLLESFLGAKLPNCYREFLSIHGGGYPEPDCFKFLDRDDGSSVQSFYGINRTDTYDLVRILNCYRNRIPEGFLPIACDPGGNQICIAIKGAERGKIFFWDHEFEADEGEMQTCENMYLISDTFDIFVKELFEID